MAPLLSVQRSMPLDASIGSVQGAWCPLDTTRALLTSMSSPGYGYTTNYLLVNYSKNTTARYALTIITSTHYLVRPAPCQKLNIIQTSLVSVPPKEMP